MFLVCYCFDIHYLFIRLHNMRRLEQMSLAALVITCESVYTVRFTSQNVR
ncbi:Uncharacterised protein [Vibrio cholerae]|nr:Uncharacterised protein [Vibrio cholerae]